MAIYRVTVHHKETGECTNRLVDAKTKAQAIAHVVSDTIAADVCPVNVAVELGSMGVKVEKAGEASE